MTRRGVERVALPDGFWRRPSTVAALRARDFVRLFDLIQRTGATQTQIGAEIGMDQGEVSKIKNGHRRPTATSVIERIAVGLRMPDHACLALGLAPANTRQGGEDAEVRRREFLVGGATTAASMAVAPLLSAVPARITARDLPRLRAELSDLYAMDDAGGGPTVFEAAFARAAAVRQILDSASYGPTVGRDLQILAGELTEMAGWSAFDLGRHGEARRLFGEALTLGAITESGPLSTLVMASMSLQASGLGLGREGVALAESAQRNARSFGSARLLSLLAAREAMGHGRAGDAAAAGRALARAEELLDDADEPGQEWLEFWGPADFHCAVASVHLRLGQPDVAERECRRALDATPERYTRNRVGYGAQLAQVLAVKGSVVEAASVAMSVSSDVGSGRVAARLCGLVPALQPYAGDPVVGECLGRLATL